jgi:signal recognition particle subunit SRP72
MQSSDPTSLLKRLSSLLQDSSSPASEILRLSDQLLQQTPLDPDLLYIKSLSLLKLDKPEQALNFLTELKKKEKALVFDNELQFLLAYLKYKQEMYGECLEGKKEEGKWGVLEAQSRFKEGKWNEAARKYGEILEKKMCGEENVEDVVVNLLSASYFCDDKEKLRAIDLSLNFAKGKEIIREIFFNLSLNHLSLGNLQKCREYLIKFKSFIQEDDEDFNDLIIYKIQWDYIDFLTFDASTDEESLKSKIAYYQEILEKKSEELDPNIHLIIRNNLIIFKSLAKSQESNIHEALKSLDETITQKGKILTPSQLFTLKLNKLLLNLSKSRIPESMKLLLDIESSFDDSLKDNKSFLLARLFLYLKTKNEEKLAEISKKISSPQQILLYLAQAELARANHRPKEALDSLLEVQKRVKGLESHPIFNEFLFNIVGLAPELAQSFKPTLYSIANNTNSLKVLAQIADLLCKQEDYTSAAVLYEKIYTSSTEASSSLLILQKLIQCLTILNSDKLSFYISKLPLPDPITDLMELKRLEKDFASLKTLTKKEDPSKKREGSRSSSKDRSLNKTDQKKNKKKKRLPKNFDPKNPGPEPDPERWLPKYQRSKFKKIFKKKGGRTQGDAGIGKETVGNFKGANTTANQEISSGKNKMKKKGKGKKK